MRMAKYHVRLASEREVELLALGKTNETLSRPLASHRIGTLKAINIPASVE